ncbi:hypothetical protein [Methylocella sp.]|uniref:hypothetical protein n=1 Tax=Methylocella sp. TaxID=1978226 RepID=UPI0037835E43
MRRRRPAALLAAAFLAAALAPARRAGAATQDADVETLRGAFRACRAMADAAPRLACYDALQARLERPTFQGRLSETTKPFVVSSPIVIRYQSDGPIFVMYLKDEKGAVVQNLHLGGGGEASFPLATPGIYTLDVTGA